MLSWLGHVPADAPDEYLGLERQDLALPVVVIGVAQAGAAIVRA
jgi:hypothetical protein